MLSSGGLSGWLSQNLTANAISLLIAPDYANAINISSRLTPSKPYIVQQNGWVVLRPPLKQWNQIAYVYINGQEVAITRSYSTGDAFWNVQYSGIVSVGDIISVSSNETGTNYGLYLFIPFKNQIHGTVYGVTDG